MQSAILMLVVLAGVVLAQQPAAQPPVPIVRQSMEQDGAGNFKTSFETANGIAVDEAGNQKQVGPKPEDVGSVSRGSYSYTAPDGQIITVNWIADENGFQPSGDHLPKAPPTPPYVLKMLDDLRAAGKL